MKIKVLAFGALLLAIRVYAQITPPTTVVIQSTDPAGACVGVGPLIFSTASYKFWACESGTWTSVSGGGGGGGTVTQVANPTVPTWLTSSIANATSTPAITLTATTGQTSHQVIGTCGSGTTFAPCSLVAADLPTIPLSTGVSGTLLAAQFPALTGDISTTAGALATTLATVNSNTGTCGDATHVGQVTLNGKGLTTACTAVAITAGGSGTVTVQSSGTLASTEIMTGAGSQVSQTPSANATVDSSGNITGLSFKGQGTTPAAAQLIAGTGNIPALTANGAGFAAPATGGTSYLLKLPNTITVGILHAAAPATGDGVNESAVTSSAVNLASADVTGVLPIANGGGTTGAVNDMVTGGGSGVANIYTGNVIDGSNDIIQAGTAYLTSGGVITGAVLTTTAPTTGQSSVVALNQCGTASSYETTALASVVCAATSNLPLFDVGGTRRGVVMNSTALASITTGDVMIASTTNTNYNISDSGALYGQPIAGGGYALGAAANPWQYLFLYGGGTFGTTSFSIGGTPTANRTLLLPDATTTLAGLAVAETFTATQTFTSPVFNTSILPGGAATAIGATATPFQYLFLYGTGTYGTGSLKFTGVPTAARTVTFPDATDTVAELGQSQTFSGANTFSGATTTTVAGAASTPFQWYKGNWFTGGSSSSTLPQLYLDCNQGTTTEPTFGTAGTGLGINSCSGFAGGELNIWGNGALAFQVFGSGNVVEGGITTTYNAIATAGPGLEGIYGVIHSTGLTGSVATATLCTAAHCPAGQYHVHYSAYQSGSACSANTTNGVSLQLTYTDTNGTAHTAFTVPIISNATTTAFATGGVMAWGATTVNAWASGDLTISSNGTIVQYATTFAQCGTGTATYGLDMAATRLQ